MHPRSWNKTTELTDFNVIINQKRSFIFRLFASLQFCLIFSKNKKKIFDNLRIEFIYRAPQTSKNQSTR